jgi:hypothetical protein
VCGDQCEVDFTSDLKNCGSCGRVAPPGTTCVEGRATCGAENLTLCGSKCVDLATDPRNCGECGRVVNVSSDPANCGACGKACSRGPNDRCQSSMCTRIARGGSNTCERICAMQGLDCVEGGAHTGDGQPAPDACRVVYQTLYCQCSYAPQ